jgi:FAD/FMN-containing dehydrogenase
MSLVATCSRQRRPLAPPQPFSLALQPQAPGIARSDGGANWPKAELTGKIVHPWDSDYADASLGWNQNFVHYPMVIVFAQWTQDVVNALTWAQQNDLAFRVRSGRHQLQGWNAVDNGLVIDVSQLKSAQIDAASLTAKVGAGLTQLEAVTALAQQGLVIPTGEAASVGVIGATLGGGLGLFTRSLGMACDLVMAAEIVVASPDTGAKAIEVDVNRDSDLLFALRGAGNGNFGSSPHSPIR